MKEYHITEDFKSDWEKNILNWYVENKRDLPWRKKENQNFYRIWISEVMLQQTSVSVVIPFYKKFIEKWPRLEDLFDASMEEILSIWQGMGYYKRAQNLFKAKELLKKNPISIRANDLKKLPGVGEYISSAISAILKDEPCPVIDVNIKRILTRVFALNHKKKSFNKNIRKISLKLTPVINNRNYCQSLMDLASLICKSQNPKCNLCPVSLACLSRGKSFEKKEKKIKKNKTTISFVVRYKEDFLLEKTSRNLLQNLYCFPLSELKEEREGLKDVIDFNKIINKWMRENNIQTSFKLIGKIKHTFTHFHLKVLIVELRLNKRIKFKNFFWTNLNDLERKPVSSLMKKIKDTIL
ncbi:MAG: NUDIX domain-containing protein [Pseudomonadota bacterium]|nr:NUDIX domain-containing protein [Pseudomonadota bacterium]